MSKARLVITAVIVEGRSQAEVGRTYEVSPGWVSKLVARYRSEGGPLGPENRDSRLFESFLCLARSQEWGRQGSNLRPRDYESPALTTELLPPGWCHSLQSRFIPSRR
jgi:hypothetical protein